MDFLNYDLAKLTVSGLGLPTIIMILTNTVKAFVPEKFHTALPYLLSMFVVLGLMGVSFVNVIAGIVLGALATGAYRMFKPVKKE